MIFGHFGRPGAHFGRPWAILDARGAILRKKTRKVKTRTPPGPLQNRASDALFAVLFFMFF